MTNGTKYATYLQEWDAENGVKECSLTQCVISECVFEEGGMLRNQ